MPWRDVLREVSPGRQGPLSDLTSKGKWWLWGWGWMWERENLHRDPSPEEWDDSVHDPEKMDRCRAGGQIAAPQCPLEPRRQDTGQTTATEARNPQGKNLHLQMIKDQTQDPSVHILRTSDEQCQGQDLGGTERVLSASHHKHSFLIVLHYSYLYLSMVRLPVQH